MVCLTVSITSFRVAANKLQILTDDPAHGKRVKQSAVSTQFSALKQLALAENAAADSISKLFGASLLMRSEGRMDVRGRAFQEDFYM
jgi:hypothetical protein